MAINSFERTLNRLRVVLAPDLPDEQLLKKFVSSSDEIAFTALVRRHGRMVLGISRRVLGNLHDSEDVFQATFLVLAQKARMVGKREALASWLYKVAYRIALKAKAKNERRRQKETQVETMAHFPTATPPIQDWEILLDEELNRLPEKYRVPIILCDLEGRTRKEVEQQLTLGAGTLSGRLTRARRLLAERLMRRGVVLSGGALWAPSSQAKIMLPPKLVAATAQKAVLVAAGHLAGVSTSVTILMKAGVKAMFISKLKATVATLVVLTALGAGGLVYSGGGATQSGQDRPLSELEKLRKENELLKVNLRVTLEKIQALENEVRTLKGPEISKSNLLGLDVQQAFDKVRQIQGAQAELERRHAEDALRQAQKARAEVEKARAEADKARRDAKPRDDAKARTQATEPGESTNRKKTSAQIPELSRALKVLGEIANRQDITPEKLESLRRAADMLDQVVRQLRSLEQNRQGKE
jgi:RNA polymerase sigma factor (sigma-70 family)